MKKTSVLLSMICATTIFQFCSSTKNQAKAVPKVTYIGNVESLMQTHCTPCHFPPKGNKKPLDTYAAVKDEIGEILESIQKNPGEKGFMPMKHPKLSDSTIKVFVQWQKDGLLEK
jgi:mono/diheme cytochrome c family protein